jgi:ATP-dependent exoDNAse (exonuclease V) beta subunit
MLYSFEEDAIQTAFFAMQNRFGALVAQEELQEIKKRVNLLLHYEPFRMLLTPNFTKEQPLKYKKKLYYIDLLIEHKDYYVVIDYKTGKKFRNEHYKQVKNYMRAVEKLSSKAARGYVCYLLEEGVELVEVF